MSKYFTRSLISTFIISLVLVAGVVVPIKPVSATTTSTCDLINLLVLLGVIPADKATTALTAFSCSSDPVISTTTPVTLNSTITVISPNGGESYEKGSTQTISWQEAPSACSSGKHCVIRASEKYNIYIENGSEVFKVASRVSGFTYSWDLVDTTGRSAEYIGKYNTGSNFKIKICGASSGVCDTSDNYFDIIRSDDPSLYPSLTLYTPEVDRYEVTLNGVTSPTYGSVDSSWCNTENPTASGIGPFEFTWGNGSKTCSSFPATYSYPIPKQAQSMTYQIEVRVKNTQGLITSRTSSSVTVPTSASLQPSITSITPNQGASGTTVTIYGSNLSGASVVNFYSPSQLVASVPMFLLRVSANSITFTLSGGFGGMVDPGLYQVSVVTSACAGGCDSNRIGFTLNAPTPPAPPLIIEVPSTPVVTVDITSIMTGTWDVSLPISTRSTPAKYYLSTITQDGSTYSGTAKLTSSSNDYSIKGSLVGGTITETWTHTGGYVTLTGTYDYDTNSYTGTYVKKENNFAGSSSTSFGSFSAIKRSTSASVDSSNTATVLVGYDAFLSLVNALRD